MKKKSFKNRISVGGRWNLKNFNACRKRSIRNVRQQLGYYSLKSNEILWRLEWSRDRTCVNTYRVKSNEY